MKRSGAGPAATLALALLAVAAPAAAQTITDPTKPPPAPASATPAASKPGVLSSFTFTFAYTADLLADLSGGTQPGEGYVDLVKVSAAYDGTTSGHAGLSGLVSIEHANGTDFTRARVGGFQAVSADEAQPGALRLYEAWLQQEILGGRGGVKAGLIDLNTTFDVQETAALFLDASHGLGPDFGDTGLNGPSDYPTPALATTVFYRPAEGWTAQLGVFDGVAGDPNHRGRFVAVEISPADGALIVAQIERRFGDVARIEAGAWSYTGAFPSLDQLGPNGAPRMVHGNDGVYGLVEGRLLAKPGSDDGGLSGWLRLGAANGDINRASNYLGAGLVYTGLIAGRDKDEAGIAIARAGFGAGARYAAALAGRPIGEQETNLEATYRYAFADWLNIQPDLQYVVRPDGERRPPNAVVAGLRFAFTTSK